MRFASSAITAGAVALICIASSGSSFPRCRRRYRQPRSRSRGASGLVSFCVSNPRKSINLRPITTATTSPERGKCSAALPTSLVLYCQSVNSAIDFTFLRELQALLGTVFSYSDIVSDRLHRPRKSEVTGRGGITMERYAPGGLPRVTPDYEIRRIQRQQWRHTCGTPPDLAH